MKRIACLWLPHWPLQRLALARPELGSRPLAIYEEHSRGGLRVVVAGQFLHAPQRILRPHPGIVPGMPLAEALALLMRNSEFGMRNESRPTTSHSALRTPYFHLEPSDPWADLQALKELARACHRYSPLVGLEDSPRPESLLLDISGIAELFGGEAAWLAQILQTFHERGLVVRAALADTIGAAWAVARQGYSVRSAECGVRSEQDIPHSALRTPHSYSIVPPGETFAALRSLPVGVLRLSDETLGLLARLGVRRVGQVAALPRSALLSRFGPELLRRLDQALGTAEEVIDAERLEVQFAAQCSFETPTTHRQTLETAAEQLIGRLAAALAKRNQGVLEFECRLQLASGEALRMPVGLFRPSNTAAHLCELLRLRWDWLRLPDAVTSIHLEAGTVATVELTQQELFVRQERPAGQRQVAALVDRLSSRLGRSAVLRPALLSDAQPEYATVYFPLTGSPPAAGGSKRPPARRLKKRQQRSSSPAPRVETLGERPSKLLRQAVPLAATTNSKEPPQAFRLAGKEHRLVHTWGPERIETGWWRTGLVRRDYYRVETTEGSRFWIFQELHSGGWFLHGEFD